MDYNLPIVSIITVNFNGTYLTQALLESVKSVDYPNIEVIVVDNASNNDPTEALLSIYPKAKIIRSNKNLGFAGGNNLGMRNALGNYYFLVNNDTELQPGSISALLDVFKSHKDAGIVSPKFHYYFFPGTIEYAGYNRVNPWTGRSSMIGCQEKDLGQYNVLRETHYAHGGGMMIPAHVQQEVGFMPELYFLYYEEFDWCEQIKRHGYKVYYQPHSLILHKESMTTGKGSRLKTYYLSRNRIIFMQRNGHGIAKAFFFIYLVTITIPKNSLTLLFQKDHRNLTAFWKALWWNIEHFKLKI